MTRMPREKDALPNDGIPSNDATDGAAASNGGASQKDEMSAGNDTSKRPASDAEIARKADEMTARAYERSRERIMERFADKEVARDIVTLAGMTEIYCADHHDDALRTPYDSEAVRAGVYPARKIPRLCPECAAHTRYGEVRRALCRREPRPSCKTCANHCYAPDEQAFQRKAMAYAGPRAMFRGHAIEAIRHLIQTRLS